MNERTDETKKGATKEEVATLETLNQDMLLVREALAVVLNSQGSIAKYLAGQAEDKDSKTALNLTARVCITARDMIDPVPQEEKEDIPPEVEKFVDMLMNIFIQ